MIVIFVMCFLSMACHPFGCFKGYDNIFDNLRCFFDGGTSTRCWKFHLGASLMYFNWDHLVENTTMIAAWPFQKVKIDNHGHHFLRWSAVFGFLLMQSRYMPPVWSSVFKLANWTLGQSSLHFDKRLRS